ncbi:DUF1622 domain-containing protein [Phosphitispora sp. TUW77]|uniref:DUF1622 domain-containing protein n=1 Tax=Phosphitispora sp. TUW77 TaxID=3152361 RepID=UPI003AB7352A
MEFLHEILTQTAGFAILFFEFMGVLVLIITGIRGAINLISKSPLIRLNLARGMALGLEFKLGSEILRTVVVRDLSEIFIVAGIIILRAAITLLIHWEIKNEEANYNQNIPSD